MAKQYKPAHYKEIETCDICAHASVIPASEEFMQDRYACDLYSFVQVEHDAINHVCNDFMSKERGEIMISTAVLQAIKDGKEIQVKFPNEDIWRYYDQKVNDNVYWTSLYTCEWRIKPQKVTKVIERWVNVYDDRMTNSVYKSEELANNFAGENRIACVKLVGHYEQEAVE